MNDDHTKQNWRRVQEAFERSLEAGAPYDLEVDLVDDSGQSRRVRATGQAERRSDGTVRVSGDLVDATEDRDAREDLAHANALLTGVLESTDDIIVARDHEGRATYFNRAFAEVVERHFGVPAEVGMDTVELQSEPFRIHWRSVLDAVGRGEAYSEVFEAPTRHGDPRTYELTLVPIRDRGRIVGSAEFTRDITERAAAEATVRESEERFRQVLANTFDGAYRRNLVSDDYDYLSPVFEQLTGFTPDELRTMPIADYLGRIHPADLPRIKTDVETSMAATDNPYYVEYRFRHRDGNYRCFGDLFSVVLDDTGEPRYRYGTVRDITEHRQIEEKLAATRRLQALGQLCAGVSHEYNNLLMGIIGYAHHLRKRLHRDDEAHDFASRIMELSELATRVSRQLLEFARPNRGVVEVTDADELVLQTIRTFRGLLGEDIVLELEPESAASLKCDRSQIQDVLLNILLNARDAMPDGGTLCVRTAHIQEDRELFERLDLDTGRTFVRLSVTDTGEGMTAEVLKRVFEPFFTTKQTGAGTGLGLSSALGIAQAHNGAIDIRSTPGRGTTVDVYLPLRSH